MLSADSNIKFILGHYPISQVDIVSIFNDINSFISKLHQKSQTNKMFILGLNLDIKREFFYNLLKKIHYKRQKGQNLTNLLESIGSNGFSIIEIITAFPNINSARFFFPYHDASSHIYLMKSVLKPRDYSLSIRQRILFNLYLLFIKFFKNTTFLYRNVFVLLLRNEQSVN